MDRRDFLCTAGGGALALILEAVGASAAKGAIAGYAGTLWCYVAMGNAWRMGVNRTEKTTLVTRGPYGFVRHPNYLFQVMMVAAIPLLLPSALAFAALAIHLLCVRTKAVDEESHLRTLLGRPYADYCARTGRWLPPMRCQCGPHP